LTARSEAKRRGGGFLFHPGFSGVPSGVLLVLEKNPEEKKK
jgi:hypothetical protein